MVVYRRLLAEGTKSDLDAAVAAEGDLAEGDLAELELNFAARVPGFESLARGLESTLELAGVPAWSDDAALVSVDPERPVWHVRWRRASLWSYVIVGAILTVVAVLVLVFWRFFRVVVVTVSKHPFLFMAGCGLVIYVGARYLLSREGRTWNGST